MFNFHRHTEIAAGQIICNSQSRWGWQRNFALPTPHVLLKVFPEKSTTLATQPVPEIQVYVWQAPGRPIW